jgi:hypothetical protein
MMDIVSSNKTSVKFYRIHGFTLQERLIFMVTAVKTLNQTVIHVLKYTVFWDVAPCGSFKNRWFGGICHLHFQGRRNNMSEEVLDCCQASSRRFLQDSHGTTSQKTAFFIVTAVKTSNPGYMFCSVDTGVSCSFCSCPVVDFLLLLSYPILYSISYFQIWRSGFHAFEEKKKRLSNVLSWQFSVEVRCYFNAVRNITHLLWQYTAYEMDDRMPTEGSICQNVLLNVQCLYFQSPGHVVQ